jgi:phosphoenolpyruvate-protein kinase (PTS system EI component)
MQVGTMIEVPRGALQADKLAEVIEPAASPFFFSLVRRSGLAEV